LVLQRGVSESTAYNPANNGAMSELDSDDRHEANHMVYLKKEAGAMQSSIEERKTGISEWRKLGER